jgi:hypothetical protein
MSQPNRSFPPFSYNIQEAPNQQKFGHQESHQGDYNLQQWFPPRPRSVQCKLPSPSTTVRSTATGPAQRPFDRSAFHQAHVLPLEDPIDPGLHDMSSLLTPNAYVSRSSYNPIARSFDDESWNPYHLRNGSTGDVRTPTSPANASFKAYRSGPRSAGSAAPRSDSGYHTQSVMSSDLSRIEQSYLPSSLRLHIGNVNVQSTSSEAPRMMRVHSGQRPQINSRNGQTGTQDNDLRCAECNEVSKCRSDYKCVLRPPNTPIVADEQNQKAQV